MAESLRITEIFYSLQGEALTVGLPTVFIRLTGCPLRCGYCDSEYAFYGGERMDISDILEKTATFDPEYVCVTGGEPLAQPGVNGLMEQLCDTGYNVSLETSGAMDVDSVDPRVDIVLDLKTPGSGESHRNRVENIPLLKNRDLVKFVITDKSDYEWAKFKIDEWGLNQRVGEVLMSPCYGKVEPNVLADWILGDRLKVRMQVQLHKVIWGDIPGV